MGWNITPVSPALRSGATIDESSGRVEIKRNEDETNRVYTVTYSDDYQSGSTNITVIPCDAPVPPTPDCSKYGFTANTLNEVPSVPSSQQLALSIYSEGELTATVVNGNNVISEITTSTAGPYYQYIGGFTENTTTSPRTAKIRYTSQDGCEWEQTVTQKKADANCNKYEFVDLGITFESHNNSGTTFATSLLHSSTYIQVEILRYLYDESSDWITYLGNSEIIVDDNHYFTYKCNVSDNTTGSTRIGKAVFISIDGCKFEAIITQYG